MNTVAPIRPIEMTAKQLDLIKRTVAADCSAEEFDLFIEVARRVGLDPFRRQIYAVVYSKDKADKRKMSIITGIDGFRSVAERSGKYRPGEDEPEIYYNEVEKNPDTNPLGIERAVVTCFKFGPDGQWHKLKGVAYWSEFAPIKEEWAYNPQAGKRQPTGNVTLPEGNWRKMPRVMIAKCAEAQAIRKGWPEDLSGIYAPEEMDHHAVDATASELVEAHAVEQRLALTKTANVLHVFWGVDKPLEAVPVSQFADRVLAFVSGLTRRPDLEGWKETNRAPLQEFWARHKSDALELRKALDARAAELQ